MASGVWPNPSLPGQLAFDGDLGARWGAEPNSTSGWLAVDPGEQKTLNNLFVHEACDRTRKFELQKKTGGKWETFFKGTILGESYSATFPPLTARHVRLDIVSATDVPTIWEVELSDNERED
jgi:hypothetical protein